MKNKVTLIAKELLNFYSCKSKCTDVVCGHETRQFGINDQCVINVCRGILKPEITERDVCNTFSYLYALFDQMGAYTTKIEIKEERKNELIYFCSFIDKLRKRNSYDKVELTKVFDFMKTFNI